MLRMIWQKGFVLTALLLVGGCSGKELGDVSGADITRAASVGLSSLFGVKSPEQRNSELAIQARPPLVLPPDDSLANPAREQQRQRAAIIDWPDDPDDPGKRAARQAAEKRVEEEEFKALRHKRIGRERALSKDELNEGRRSARRSVPTTSPTPIYDIGPKGHTSRPASSDELRGPQEPKPDTGATQKVGPFGATAE